MIREGENDSQSLGLHLQGHLSPSLRHHPASSMGFCRGSVVKNPPSNAGDAGLGSVVWEDSLEKETATHSSILAQEILQPETPSIPWGRKRVRHNLATKQQNRLYSQLHHTNSVATCPPLSETVHFLFL